MLWKIHRVSWCNRFMLSLLWLPQYFCNLKALICSSPVVVKIMWCNKMRQQCWENPIWSLCINFNHLNMVLNIFPVAMATFYMTTINTDYSNTQIQIRTSQWHNNNSFVMSFSLYRTKRKIFSHPWAALKYYFCMLRCHRCHVWQAVWRVSGSLSLHNRFADSYLLLVSTAM